MRITIDARMMGPANTRGIGRYTEEIVRAMLALGGGHTFVLLERNPDTSPFRGVPNVEHMKADIRWYSLAEQIQMPGIIRRAKADLLFVPHWNVTIFPTHPCTHAPTHRVVFIHDLILLEEPASANITTRGPFVAWIKRLGHKIALRHALYRSQAVLVPTQYGADRIRHFYPDLKTDILVTGEGMPEIDQNIWQEPDLDHPYVMTVGSAYPHKNLEMLFEAWKIVSGTHPDIRLLVVGKKDAFMQKLIQKVQGAVHNPQPITHNLNIEFLGEVPDDDLKRLYTKALALVFPSRHEGFGLPPLEALSAGCPVLSSDSSCMPEVLGNEGIIYFNPGSPDAIVRAIETVLEDPGGVRGEARRIAPILRRRHDWREAASQTLSAFERAVASYPHADERRRNP